MTDTDRRNVGIDERDDRSPLGETAGDTGIGRIGNAPRPPDDPNVLSNAVQRTDNGFNGKENDESLIGTDIEEDEDEDLDEIDKKRAERQSLDDVVRDLDR